MQMEIEAAGDRLTARIKGELDHHSAAQARAQLDALLTDERIRELRIDLRGLTFMDSSGLGVILGRYRVIAGSAFDRFQHNTFPSLFAKKGLLPAPLN